MESELVIREVIDFFNFCGNSWGHSYGLAIRLSLCTHLYSIAIFRVEVDLSKTWVRTRRLGRLRWTIQDLAVLYACRNINGIYPRLLASPTAGLRQTLGKQQYDRRLARSGARRGIDHVVVTWRSDSRLRSRNRAGKLRTIKRCTNRRHAGSGY